MSWSAIIWAGFVATTLAAACMWVFRNYRWTQFSPATQLGCFFIRDPRLPATEGVGLLLLFVLGSSLLSAVYSALLEAFGGPSWGTGLLLGLLHGALAVAALPYAARVSACVRAGFVPPPGPLGMAWGRGTAAGIVLAHVVYGGVLGWTLQWFATPVE